MEANGGNNHLGAWYFHLGPDAEFTIIGERPHFSKNFDRALSASSEFPTIELYCPRSQDTSSNQMFRNTSPLGSFRCWKTNIHRLVQMCQTEKHATNIHISSKKPEFVPGSTPTHLNTLLPCTINPWPCGFSCSAQPSLVSFKPCKDPHTTLPSHRMMPLSWDFDPKCWLPLHSSKNSEVSIPKNVHKTYNLPPHHDTSSTPPQVSSYG